MPRPTRALVDLDALRRNYERAAALAAPAKAVAVVKANAYGHGLVPVAQTLASLAPMYAVALLEEAQVLRAAVPDKPVLLMQGVHDAADWPLCGANNFIAVLHCPEQLEALKSAVLRTPTVLWIKLNTGMNRLGFRPAELKAVLTALAKIPQVTVEGLMTHFASADDPDSEQTLAQVEVMERLRETYPGLTLSAANSAAHYTTRAGAFDWTRPGIMLYSGAPLLGRTGQDLGLDAVMTLESRLIAVRHLEAGEFVGYGAAWRASQATRMGIIAIGYGDGYPRHTPAGTPVMIRGKRMPLIGRVSMDMLAVDLGALPEAQTGDLVELWGPNISVDEVARAAGTISYDLLTGVTARVPRVYLPGS